MATKKFNALTPPFDLTANSVGDLIDHTKAVHDALLIDADTLDGNDSTAFAVAAKGVTNGDSHDHFGGDGAQIDHVNLANKGTNTHAQIDTALGTTIPATYIKKDGSTPLTADWDAGSFELRAQTLESDVATGTAPLTIASTTKVTNLNADLLDGLHDTGYTKTTAGQTINVATAAELTTALANLAAAPSLLGNVIIQLAAGTYTFTDTVLIPALIYNGFTLTIKGNLDETILVDTATGGTATVYGNAAAAGTYGYAEKTTASYTVNAYKHKLLKNPSGQYTMIESNTATRILHGKASANFTTFVNGNQIKVADWNTIITGGISNPLFKLAPGAQCYIQDLKIYNTVGQAVYCSPFSILNYTRCFLDSDNASITLLGDAVAQIDAFDSLIYNTNMCYRGLSNSRFWSLNTSNIFYLKGTPTGNKNPFNLNTCSINLGQGWIIDGQTKAVASRGIWAASMSFAQLYYGFIQNIETGVYSSFGGIARDVNLTSYINVTTQRTPTTADPATSLNS